ncbi:heavy-metal-associated domain-containing protein [Pseudonocardia nigra]|uniref:heavy-metal-associated domain-containing protein n=1 Tax=Pseudonocardia nigra TaxID=1921578 RepID=UPI0027E31C3C|nr:cation transporter [Pseudonocardia nigra]
MARGATAAVRSTETGGPGQVQRVDFTVEGMMCASCAMRVQKALNKQAGVTAAEVNFGTAGVHVDYRPGEVDVDVPRAAADRAGYHLEPITPARDRGD